MKQNMARTLLHHARRDIKPFNTWPYPSRSSVIFCDWTPAPILSAVKVNQDSFLIDRIKSMADEGATILERFGSGYFM
jgi:hypothetical protein